MTMHCDPTPTPLKKKKKFIWRKEAAGTAKEFPTWHDCEGDVAAGRTDLVA